MSTETTTFTEPGVQENALLIQRDGWLKYSATGRFTGYIRLERAQKDGTWDTALLSEKDEGIEEDTLQNAGRDARYRFRASKDFVGSATCTMAHTEEPTAEELRRGQERRAARQAERDARREPAAPPTTPTPKLTPPRPTPPIAPKPQPKPTPYKPA